MVIIDYHLRIKNQSKFLDLDRIFVYLYYEIRSYIISWTPFEW